MIKILKSNQITEQKVTGGILKKIACAHYGDAVNLSASYSFNITEEAFLITTNDLEANKREVEKLASSCVYDVSDLLEDHSNTIVQICIFYFLKRMKIIFTMGDLYLDTRVKIVDNKIRFSDFVRSSTPIQDESDAMIVDVVEEAKEEEKEGNEKLSVFRLPALTEVGGITFKMGRVADLFADLMVLLDESEPAFLPTEQGLYLNASNEEKDIVFHVAIASVCFNISAINRLIGSIIGLVRRCCQADETFLKRLISENEEDYERCRSFADERAHIAVVVRKKAAAYRNMDLPIAITRFGYLLL